ncbi:MAG: DNA replication protein psf2 [Watsoniomyces obsoletus]|nr:MAG: DNA replication protein psf2 [Watsoniomyces obsoletus]
MPSNHDQYAPLDDPWSTHDPWTELGHPPGRAWSWSAPDASPWQQYYYFGHGTWADPPSWNRRDQMIAEETFRPRAFRRRGGIIPTDCEIRSQQMEYPLPGGFAMDEPDPHGSETSRSAATDPLPRRLKRRVGRQTRSKRASRRRFMPKWSRTRPQKLARWESNGRRWRGWMRARTKQWSDFSRSLGWWTRLDDRQDDASTWGVEDVSPSTSTWSPSWQFSTWLSQLQTSMDDLHMADLDQPLSPRSCYPPNQGMMNRLHNFHDGPTQESWARQPPPTTSFTDVFGRPVLKSGDGSWNYVHDQAHHPRGWSFVQPTGPHLPSDGWLSVMLPWWPMSYDDQHGVFMGTSPWEAAQAPRAKMRNHSTWSDDLDPLQERRSSVSSALSKLRARLFSERERARESEAARERLAAECDSLRQIYDVVYEQCGRLRRREQRWHHRWRVAKAEVLSPSRPTSRSTSCSSTSSSSKSNACPRVPSWADWVYHPLDVGDENGLESPKARPSIKESKRQLKRYNAAWQELSSTSSRTSSIPWPTTTLRPEELTHPHGNTQDHNLTVIVKYNVLRFLLVPFGFSPIVEERSDPRGKGGSSVVFKLAVLPDDEDRGRECQHSHSGHHGKRRRGSFDSVESGSSFSSAASSDVPWPTWEASSTPQTRDSKEEMETERSRSGDLEGLKIQLKLDIKRWHPDRLQNSLVCNSSASTPISAGVSGGTSDGKSAMTEFEKELSQDVMQGVLEGWELVKNFRPEGDSVE